MNDDIRNRKIETIHMLQRQYLSDISACDPMHSGDLEFYEVEKAQAALRSQPWYAYLSRMYFVRKPAL